MLRLNSLHHEDCRTPTALGLSALCGDIVEGYVRGLRFVKTVGGRFAIGIEGMIIRNDRIGRARRCEHIHGQKTAVRSMVG